MGKLREEARQLFLTGELDTNAEIASRVGVKPHTIGRWRKDEAWNDLRLKIDRRAAEMFVEKIATERMTLNVHHYRYWQLLLTNLGETLKKERATDVKSLDRIAGILERAQKGQRLAKGLSLGGETEEAIRAEAEAENRRLIDIFVESIKENVADEETKERIRQTIVSALPQEEGTGARDALDESNE
jgi:hypothetical protein